MKESGNEAERGWLFFNGLALYVELKFLINYTGNESCQ